MPLAHFSQSQHKYVGYKYWLEQYGKDFTIQAFNFSFYLLML
jgi:hypothetical protein